MLALLPPEPATTMIDSTFDKTEKGRDEIATRKYQLASRLRALLLLFDGKRTTAEVLAKVAGIGLTEQNIAELARGGYIHLVKADAATSPAALIPAPNPTPSEEKAQVEIAASPRVQQPIHNDALDRLSAIDGQTQLEALYNFYTETIRSAIGLRGYALQLKVERARSVEDFRHMKNDYLAAVTKAQGEEVAHALNERLERLLNMDPTPSLEH